jgi:hypothetical protein
MRHAALIGAMLAAASCGGSGSGSGAHPDADVDAGADAGAGGSVDGTADAAPAGDDAADAAGDGSTVGLTALMVTNGASTPTAGDAVMRGRLLGRGFQVSLVSDALVTAGAVADQDLVVISSSAESGTLGTKLRDVARPIVCIENGAFPIMGMTGTTLATDYGSTFNQTAVNMSAGGSALAGTLTGTVTISSTPAELGWAVPAAAAVVAATMADNPAHAALFGYAGGSQMVGLVAPARRVGFAIRETLAANLTADGLTLFDAAVTFALAK